MSFISIKCHFNLIINILDVSQCWNEFNFVRTEGPEYPPIIFHDFTQEKTEFNLVYSEGLKIGFEPEKVGIFGGGFLYHEIPINDLEFGLFSSELSVKLYELLQVVNQINFKSY